MQAVKDYPGVLKAHNLDYIERKIVHSLRMGADAGRNARTGAATTRDIMAARGEGSSFVPATKDLKALSRVRRAD